MTRSGHTHDAPLADAVSALRTSGRRLTRQRSLVWDTLLDSPGLHLSAADIAELVRTRAPELHRATIYRTLERLVEDGLLLRTDLGQDRSYYELPAGHRHHHVVCRDCGRVDHVHDDVLQAVIRELAARTGFTFMKELTVAGQCATCSGA